MATEARFVDSLAEELAVGELAFADVLGALVGSLAERFDPEQGGFGGAPKFPRPSYVEALLVHHVRTGDPGSLAMATLTLDAMAAGGIYDHLAGGFARYSVDARWRVPHFEKMLTDQALLVRCYLHAWQLTGRDDYAQVVTETLDWLLDELALEAGGLASSIDADAAGVEGSHAVFRPDEVAAALEGVPGALSAEEACAFYLITPEGTFEEGSSVLARPLGAGLRRSEGAEETRRALLEARRRRPAPAIDDKVLVEWNAMAAAALAEAAAAMGVERWGLAAAELVELLDGTFHDASGRLLRAGRGEGRRHLAMLGDHAWLLEAMTRLYELDGEDRWLERAQPVAEAMLSLFWDGEIPSALEPQRGAGFFTTGHDAEQLLARTKELFDGALPSATATAVTSLIRLARLTGDADLLASAERSVELVSSILERHPLAVPDLVLALGWLEEGLEVVVPGAAGSLLGAVRGAVRALRRDCPRPRRALRAARGADRGPRLPLPPPCLRAPRRRRRAPLGPARRRRARLRGPCLPPGASGSPRRTRRPRPPRTCSASCPSGRCSTCRPARPSTSWSSAARRRTRRGSTSPRGRSSGSG